MGILAPNHDGVKEFGAKKIPLSGDLLDFSAADVLDVFQPEAKKFRVALVGSELANRGKLILRSGSPVHKIAGDGFAPCWGRSEVKVARRLMLHDSRLDPLKPRSAPSGSFALLFKAVRVTLRPSNLNDDAMVAGDTPHQRIAPLVHLMLATELYCRELSDLDFVNANHGKRVAWGGFGCKMFLEIARYFFS